jgi:hypothetical protein
MAMSERVKQWLDSKMSKFISRKLLVFTVSTVLLALGNLDADNWTTLAVAYVGVEGFVDIAIRMKQARS